MTKLILVFGARGVQGGSVARALLSDTRSFRVRIVSRNPNNELAQELADLGAEVVQGDLDDPSTLSEALSGCHGVFGVTNYFNHLDRGREVAQGKALVDACKDAGIQHLVFSLSKSAKESVDLEVPQFEAKAEIEKYMLESGVPCTSVHYPFHMENLFRGPMKIKEQHDGSYGLVLPMDDEPLHMLAASEAGKAVAAIFRCPDNYYGRVVGFQGDKMTVKQMARILSKHLAPKIFRPSVIPLEQFARMGFPGADEIAAMFDFFKRGKQDLNQVLTRHLDPGTKTFEEWVIANKDAIERSLAED